MTNCYACQRGRPGDGAAAAGARAGAPARGGQLVAEHAEERNFSHWTEFATEEQFPGLLSDFLYSSHGAKYKSSFKEQLSALVVSICTLTYSLYKFY